MGGFVQTFGQDSTATEEETTYRSRMSLTADQYPDGTIELKGLLRVKYDKGYQVVPEAKISFYVISSEGEEVALEDKMTNDKGISAIQVDKANLIADESGYFTFKARFDGKNQIGESENDLAILPATLSMEATTEDSIYIVKISAIADSPDGPLPVAEQVVSLYVKRMFSLLKVGEAETDEEGYAEIEFPNDLAGDQNANLEISASISETDEYGTLRAKTTKPWGYSVSEETKELPRALWSPHPPAWMVVTFFILMGTVWTHYGIIVYKLFLIRKEKPTP